MKLLERRVVAWGLGIALGIVFLYASYDKILKPSEFARIVYHYQLVGPGRIVGPLPANLVAVTLPWIEVVVGLLLVSGVWRREAAGVAACLLLGFLIAVGAALARGIDIENCGCFSVSGAGRRAGLTLLLGDLALLCGALALALPRLPRRASLTASEPDA